MGGEGLAKGDPEGPKWAVGSTRFLHTLMILFLEPGRGEGFQPLCRDRAWVRSLLPGFNLITFALSMDSWILILSKERETMGQRSGGAKKCSHSGRRVWRGLPRGVLAMAPTVMGLQKQGLDTGGDLGEVT